MKKLNLADVIGRYGQVPERIRWPAALSFFVALFLGHFFLLHADQERSLEQLQDDVSRSETEHVEKGAFASNIKKYEARLGELTEKLNTAHAMLPDQPDVPQFLAVVGNTARELGLVVDRFEPKPEVVADGNNAFYSEVGFEVHVHGTYHEIAMFVDQLGKMDRLVNVANLSLANPKAEAQKVILEGKFRLKTFRFMSQDEITKYEAAKKSKK